MPVTGLTYTPRSHAKGSRLCRIRERLRIVAGVAFLIAVGRLLWLAVHLYALIGFKNHIAVLAPVRQLVHGIETFNVLRGGEYFFMPSLSALNWIAKGFQ